MSQNNMVANDHSILARMAVFLNKTEEALDKLSIALNQGKTQILLPPGR